MNSLEREIARSFYLWIPTDQDSDSIALQLQQAIEVEQAVQRMLKGEIGVEEAFQAIEMVDIELDNYVDEVVNNVWEVVEQNQAAFVGEQQGLIFYG
ncbi:MAG TPA: hypothetical protein VK211_08765 [Kamptonema sp.]|nr:hypothetical protein [Kamptonema sp.]